MLRNTNDYDVAQLRRGVETPVRLQRLRLLVPNAAACLRAIKKKKNGLG